MKARREKMATIVVGAILVFGYFTVSLYRHVSFVRESKKYLGVWQPWLSWGSHDQLEIRPDSTYTLGKTTYRWHLGKDVIVLESPQGDILLGGDSKYLSEGYFDSRNFVRPNDPKLKEVSGYTERG